LLALQTDLSMTPVAGTLAGPDESGEVVVMATTSGPTPQAGIAFLGAFVGGHRHAFRTKVALERAEWLRIEVHGHVSRMNKIVAHLSQDGTVLLQGEEVESITVSREGKTLTIEMTFRARGSMVEWIYLFGQAVATGTGPVLRCSTTSLETLPEADPSLTRRHFPIRTINGISVACQMFTVLHGCFNMIVEIHNADNALVGLGLSSELELAHVQWWTWPTNRLKPRSGELVMRRSAHPIRSPALMDAFGPACANLGHAISGVFADWHDLDRMDAATADRRAKMTLHARFASGAIIDLPLRELLDMTEAASQGNPLFDKYRIAYRSAAPETPTFLEVGARGDASAAVRQLVAPQWRYIGLDYAPGSNVDIVGDAHRLTDFVPRESVDMVYSSEVMEHLLSPLRFVFEANRVLKQQGLFIARMPTTWPLHAEPWDFWRISMHGWTSILNRNTGFEILERSEVGRAAVVPQFTPPNSGLMSMAAAPAPMLTMVIARKIRDVPHDNSGWSEGLASGNYDHA